MENINAKKDSSSEFDSKENLLNLKAKERGVSPEEFKAQIAKDKEAIPSTLGVPELVKRPLAEPIYEHLKAALDKLNIHYRCNCDVGEVWEFKRKGEANFSEWSEAQLLELKQNIIVERMTYLKPGNNEGKEVPLKFTREQFFESVEVMMERKKVYPFREYLKQCIIEPFSELTIENWLFESMKVEDTPFNRWASKLIFLSVVQRVYQPGCAQRVTPLLIGAPGIGKSSLVRGLLPPEFLQYYSDNFNFSSLNKEKIEQTIDHIVIEITELGGFSRADRSELKAYLTRQEDKVRMAYARKVSKFKRKFAFIGTANPDASKTTDDPALRERLAIINCNAVEHKNMAEFLDEHREHLWAEALNEYKAGERVYDVPKELQESQAKESEGLIDRDESLEDRVLSINFTENEKDCGVSLNHIGVKARMIKEDEVMEKRDQMRLSKQLQEMGFLKGRDGRRRVWIPPVIDEPF